MTQVRRRIDAGWTLAAIYAAYVVVSLPMQQEVWVTLASGDAGLGKLNKTALALFVVTFGAVALAAYLAPATSEELSRRLSEWLRRRVGLALSLLLTTAIVAPVAVAYAVLDCFPNSGDEFAYYFQAGLFAKGQLWAEAPPLGYTFVPYRTWIIGDKWLSQYPPGWPVAMAAALLTGIPAWSLNALMGVASAAGLMSPLWRYPDRAGALVVAGTLRADALLRSKCGVVPFAHAVGPPHPGTLPVLSLVRARSSAGGSGGFGRAPRTDRHDPLLLPCSYTPRALLLAARRESPKPLPDRCGHGAGGAAVRRLAHGVPLPGHREPAQEHVCIDSGPRHFRLLLPQGRSGGSEADD